MRKVGQAADTAAYCTLIRGSCTAGNLEGAMALFHQTRARGVALDEATLIHASCQHAKVNFADAVFEAMQEHSHLKTTHVTFAMLVKAYGRACCGHSVRGQWHSRRASAQCRGATPSARGIAGVLVPSAGADLGPPCSSATSSSTTL